MLVAFFQHLFSSAKEKTLDIVRTMQTPTLGRFRIPKKHRVWYFTRVEKIWAQVFLKFVPGSGLDVPKVTEKLKSCHSVC